MTRRPSVSVIVPTYNAVSFIREAIQSILTQDLPPLEILVVDDCSIDHTLAIVDELSKGSPIPIQAHCMGRNSGSPAAPINRGVERARGELIAVLEQDDTFLPNKLAEQTAALAEHPDAVMAFGLCYRLGTQRIGSRSQSKRIIESLQGAGESTKSGYLLSGRALFEQIVWHGSVFSGFPGFVFRRDAWQAIGGVSTHWRIGSDLNFVCALCARGSVVFVPQPHYARRFHRGSLSANGLRAHADLLEILDAHLVAGDALLSAEQTKTSMHRYATYAAWYAAYTGNLKDGVRLWQAAQRAFGYRARSIPDAAMLLFLRSMVAITLPRRMTADVSRAMQAIERISKKLR